MVPLLARVRVLNWQSVVVSRGRHKTFSEMGGIKLRKPTALLKLAIYRSLDQTIHFRSFSTQ